MANFDSDPFNLVGTPTPPSGTSLATMAGNLALGAHDDFTPNTLQHPQDIQWNTETIFYDSSRKELQYMGKPAASQSNNHSHYIYTEGNPGAWSTTGQALFPGNGHIWDQTFDPVNGDYWFRQFNTNFLRWYDRSASQWKTTSAQSSPDLNSGGGGAIGGIGWHPNLFGASQPGIFVWGIFRFFAYNLTTQSWSGALVPSNLGSPYLNRKYGQSVYLPGVDQLVCWANGSGGGIRVNAGAGLQSDVLSSGHVGTIATPPVPVYGAGGTSTQGHVVRHPSDDSRLLLMEEHGSSRVWDSTNAGVSWSQKGYTHPFQGMNNISTGEYTVGRIDDYGVVVGMTSNASGGECVIWRPGD